MILELSGLVTEQALCALSLPQFCLVHNSSDKKIMALIDMLDGNYPDHLSEKQKGEYLVGYYQQRSANIKDAEEKKNRKAAKIETNNTDTATTVATQKEK